jgi:type VI secretion system protein ImpK
MATQPARKTPTRPTLLELTSGVFTLILSLRQASDLGQEESLRQRITTYLDGFEREALDLGVIHEDLDKARFALVAFIDETILDSDWSQCETWRDRPLQLDLFAERRAGGRFFDEMDQLRRQGETKREVVEVYHQCLNLGFEGKYRVSGRDQLAVVKSDLERYLGIDARDRRELKLSPHGKRRDSANALAKDDFPFWRLAAVGGAVLVVLFLIFLFWINYTTGQAIGSIGGTS